MQGDPEEAEKMRQAWRSPPPGRLVGRGHSAGDLLEAFEWELESESLGELSLKVTLPNHLRNPRGDLFGGFTATYADLVALLTIRAGTDRSQVGWMMTTSMNLEYLSPVRGPDFRIASRIVHQGRRTFLVETKFLTLDGELCALALTKFLAENTQSTTA